MKRILIIFMISLFSLTVFSKTNSETILIKNGTIVPVVGEIIKKGDLLIKEGKIACIGKEILQPKEAKIIDASGMWVYPGFIDSFTHLGLVEIFSIPATMDTRELGKENPELKVAWAINPHSVHFATSRINGTTTALVAPSGGTFPGITALVKMDGWTIDEMLIKDEATSMIDFPTTPRATRASRMGKQEKAKIDMTAKIVEKIKKYLSEARRYHELKKVSEEKGGMPKLVMNAKYEGLKPVIEGKIPVILSVEKAKDIKTAIKFVKEEKLKVIFRGCLQGYKVAKRIANAKIPVIIDSLYTGPCDPEEAYDAQWTNISELVKAGVMICFSSGENVGTAKDLPYHAARAVAFGLKHEDAIKALTINPAKIFGVDDRLGSLEKGKDADLFITTSDPLDVKSEVKYLFINGKSVNLDNWWESQYNKWKKRPNEKAISGNNHIK